MSLSLEQCYDRYGKLQADPAGGLVWSKALDWIKPIAIPEEIKMVNYLGKPVYRIFANIDMHAPLRQAFNMLIDCGAHKELKEFSGAFNVRWIRGMPGVVSFHSFAVAIDFNAKENPMGSRGKWSNQFIECMIAAGFDYGGNFSKRPDPMHWQLSKIPTGKILNIV